MTNHTQYLRPSEVAAQLGMSYFTVSRYIREGKIKAHRFPAGWRVPVSAVEEYCSRYGVNEE